MTTEVSNTLLAFLLALKNLETPLIEKEKKALAKIGQRLKKNPKDWDFTKDKLMAILEANDALNQLYQEAKAKLDALNSSVSLNLIPTKEEKEELETILPPESKGGTRAHLPYGEGQANKQSNEIFNLTVKVLPTEKPEETAKQLTFLERLSNS